MSATTYSTTMVSLCTLSVVMMLAVLCTIPAHAQTSYRVFLKDANPAQTSIVLWVFSKEKYREVDLLHGFAELELDSGEHMITLRTAEISMKPSGLHIVVPEQAADTFSISTTITKGLSTVPVLSFYFDTTNGALSETSDFDFRLVDTNNPLVTFTQQEPRRSVAVFDSVPAGIYRIVPLYDTTRYLDPRAVFVVGINHVYPHIRYIVRNRCRPKFTAFAVTVESDDWRESLSNEVVFASGIGIDDDSWQREMPFALLSSPATAGRVTVTSNGWLSLGWEFGESNGLLQPLSGRFYSPVIASVFAQDLKGRESTRITEAVGLRNGLQTYTVSWYDMSVYTPDFTESDVHLNGRAILVEDGAIGIEFGPIIADNLPVEIGICGGDRYDVRSLFVHDNWLTPELKSVASPIVLSDHFRPPPGTTYWLSPIGTSVEFASNAAPGVVPCPARFVVRLKQACMNQSLSTTMAVLYSPSGAMVSVPCEQDGEDLLIHVHGLASGSYQTTIEMTRYVFIVER